MRYRSKNWLFFSLWVSTDHDEIAKVARDCGAMVHRRTAEVSQDHTTSIETTKEFLSSHSGKFQFFISNVVNLYD